MDPATIGAAAMCDGVSATWTVTWFIRPVTGPITVTTASDPVNGATPTPVGNTTTAPPNQALEKVQLPGTATVAALAATLSLADGTSQVENRTVQLGAPCTVQPAVACDPSKVQVGFSTTADQASAVLTGPCAGSQFYFSVRMPDPHGRNWLYSLVRSYINIASATRQVFAADLPPCQWIATALPGTPEAVTYTGGSGPCTDDSTTVTQQCPYQLVVTLSNGADAVLPTTFVIYLWEAPGSPASVSYRQVAPGQSVTMTFGVATTFGSAASVSVWNWGSYLGGAGWQGLRCSPLSAETPYPRFPSRPGPRYDRRAVA
jgi:hypothetical protein